MVAAREGVYWIEDSERDVLEELKRFNRGED